MTQFNVIGQILDTSGYSIHTRNLANALDKLHPVRLSVNLVPGWESVVTDRELVMLKRKPEEDEINIIVTNPIYWRVNCGKRNWAFLVWEGDKIPKCFIEECLNDQIEYILVPSNHTKQAIENTTKDKKILNKIRIIPHGVDLNLFYPMEKPKVHTFLINKGWRNSEDRGGTQYAVQAYLEEFTDKDNVELYIKINAAYGITDLNKLIESVAPKRTDLPRINIDVTSYPYKDLVKVYNRGTVFVGVSRAEAYHLGCIEAMACGLPVITTNFGGQTDFVNDKCGWIINGKLTEVKHEFQYEGIKWLTPDIREIRKAMRESYTNQEITRHKGNAAVVEASKNGWEVNAKLLSDLSHRKNLGG